jgi:hypothetical protein
MALNSEETVMRFVEGVLEADPTVGSAEIYERAKGIDPGVEALTLRQFNARFPLQVKRRRALERSGARGNGRRSRAARARREVTQLRTQYAVREAFLRFAADLSAAEENAELVRVIAGVDEYVEAVIEATR